ncbi:glycosyl transferase family 2 [Candidatus Woesearchaeota archaeon]|nr:glycosyl transferase family 2 [Candidatus Woesearchaeota archaeon]|tara:strand:- start:12644 stop:13567 length:924 start_codon:yes stop_codon:yes gene_type:complete
MSTELSVVIPAYNEEENIEPLADEIVKVLQGKQYEIIFIDDGSTDSTTERVIALNKKNKNIHLIQFRKNFGQTAAMDAGFKHAKGKIVIPMDADMQNDPADIPRMLSELQNHDAVVGWRKNRADGFFKKFFSKIANFFRKRLTGEKIHDSGCTLRVIRKEALNGLDLYGEMHRFIPSLLMWKGFDVGEVIVRHRPRHSGKTKYNFKRLLKGFLDILVIKFWTKYSTRPIHLFGGLGLFFSFLGVAMGIYLVALKVLTGASLANRPLLLLAVLLVVLGTQFVLFGFMADILVKTHYKGQTSYSIKRTL